MPRMFQHQAEHQAWMQFVMVVASNRSDLTFQQVCEMGDEYLRETVNRISSLRVVPNTPGH